MSALQSNRSKTTYKVENRPLELAESKKELAFDVKPKDISADAQMTQLYEEVNEMKKLMA